MDEEITWDDVRKFYVPKEHVQPNYDFGEKLTEMMDDMLRKLTTQSQFTQFAYGGVYAYWDDAPRAERFDQGVFVVDGEVEDPIVGKGTQMVDGKWQPRGFLGPAAVTVDGQDITDVVTEVSWAQESPQSDADD